MSTETTNASEPVEADWSRLGVLLAVAPSHQPPDPEDLLLRTARVIPERARLLTLAVSWLAAYGGFVARHRLRRLVIATLEPQHQATLGLVIESAIQAGGSPDLSIVSQACAVRVPGEPLFVPYQGHASLRAIAEHSASTLSRRWGVWAPPIEPKHDALRPVEWVLDQNPDAFGRIVRKGDLRCSVLESLRRDAGGSVRSESELARLSGATRAAVRKSLHALVQEGEVRYHARGGRGRVVELCRAVRANASL